MYPWLAFLLTAIVGASVTVAPPPQAEPPLPPQLWLPLVSRSYRSGPPPLVLSALYYDTYLANEPDEAFQLYNPLEWPVTLEGWQVSDGRRITAFPAGINLAANARLWCARKAVSFTVSFGFKPACEYSGNSDPTVPDLTGSALQFANTGGRVTLLSPQAAYSDTLVYEDGDTNVPGWQGPAVYPYRSSTNFGAEEQILYRKLAQATGLPVRRMLSGPYGGDAQIAALAAEGKVDGVIFLVDPLYAHPHEPDIQGLLRVCNVYNVPVATNEVGAEYVLHGLLGRLDRLVAETDR